MAGFFIYKYHKFKLNIILSSFLILILILVWQIFNLNHFLVSLICVFIFYFYLNLLFNWKNHIYHDNNFFKKIGSNSYFIYCNFLPIIYFLKTYLSPTVYGLTVVPMVLMGSYLSLQLFNFLKKIKFNYKYLFILTLIFIVLLFKINNNSIKKFILSVNFLENIKLNSNFDIINFDQYYFNEIPLSKINCSIKIFDFLNDECFINRNSNGISLIIGTSQAQSLAPSIINFNTYDIKLFKSGFYVPKNDFFEVYEIKNLKKDLLSNPINNNIFSQFDYLDKYSNVDLYIASNYKNLVGIDTYEFIDLKTNKEVTLLIDKFDLIFKVFDEISFKLNNNTKIYLFSEIPSLKDSTIENCLIQLFSNCEINNTNSNLSFVNEVNQYLFDYANNNKKFEYIDLLKYFCSDDREKCHLIKDNKFIYMDNQHINLNFFPL